MLKNIIHKLTHSHETVTPGDTESAVTAILSGQCEAAQIGAYLTALTIRDMGHMHLLAAKRALMQQAVLIEGASGAFDCCGTGGDGLHTLNISTAVSFVLAGCGVKMAKHGNRSASSQCGAADVLEAMGVTLVSDAAALANAINTIDYAFCMAPHHHPALVHLSPIRKALGIRTLFNLTGPLVNPACVRVQLIGTYCDKAQKMLQKTLSEEADKLAWIVTAEDGMDELSLATPSRLISTSGECWTWAPEDFGIKRQPISSIQGGDAAFNAQALSHLLDGQDGPYQDAVVMNAAAALLLLNKCDHLHDAAMMARQSLTQGKAKTIFLNYKQWSRNA